MANVLNLYNAAISAAGGKGRLSSLSQASREREACDTWYPIVRDAVQEAAYWPSSKTMNRLALIATRTPTAAWVAGDPIHPYTYSYALPNDYLRARYLVDYSRFEITFDDSRGYSVLNAQMPQAVLVYSKRNDLPAQWTPGQYHATVFALAAHITTELGLRGNLASMNMQKANDLLLAAQASAATGDNMGTDVVPPAIAARGVQMTMPDRYYYPQGNVFIQAAGVNAS